MIVVTMRMMKFSMFADSGATGWRLPSYGKLQFFFRREGDGVWATVASCFELFKAELFGLGSRLKALAFEQEVFGNRQREPVAIYGHQMFAANVDDCKVFHVKSPGRLVGG